jgi:hypothetical protein
MISIVLRRARAVVLGTLSGTVFGEIRNEVVPLAVALGVALVTPEAVLAVNSAAGAVGAGSALRVPSLVNDGTATDVGVGGRSNATPTHVSVAPNAAPPNHGQTGCSDCRGTGGCILNGA